MDLGQAPLLATSRVPSLPLCILRPKHVSNQSTSPTTCMMFRRTTFLGLPQSSNLNYLDSSISHLSNQALRKFTGILLILKHICDHYVIQNLPRSPGVISLSFLHFKPSHQRVWTLFQEHKFIKSNMHSKLTVSHQAITKGLLTYRFGIEIACIGSDTQQSLVF